VYCYLRNYQPRCCAACHASAGYSLETVAFTYLMVHVILNGLRLGASLQGAKGAPAQQRRTVRELLWRVGGPLCAVPNCTVTTTQTTTVDNVGVAWCGYVESYAYRRQAFVTTGLPPQPPAGLLLNAMHLNRFTVPGCIGILKKWKSPSYTHSLWRVFLGFYSTRWRAGYKKADISMPTFFVTFKPMQRQTLQTTSCWRRLCYSYYHRVHSSR
jgi:hypothetical protein